MTTKNALNIFIKTPVPYQVKTRFQPQLTGEESAKLYSAFLQDLDHKFAGQTGFQCCYAISPEYYDQEILKKIVNLTHFFMQQGDDFGKRKEHAFETSFSKGFGKVVLISSDVPAITTNNILESFKALNDHDCVIGPSEDGGYYLIALKSTMPFLFQDIPWNTSDVYGKTIDILRDKNMTYKILPPYQDVDTIKQLLSFYRYLQIADKKSADFPSNSWRILRDILSERI